jgi:cold shock CspA family protein
MRKAFGIPLAVLALLLMASAGYAEKRPHEGRVVKVETVERSTDMGGESIANVQRSMIVQGEKGDQWTLYWDDTTKFKNGLSPTQLREGDKVHFEFVERDGKMWVTELRRTKKAD